MIRALRALACSALVLAVVVAAALAGCGPKKPAADPAPTPAPTGPVTNAGPGGGPVKPLSAAQEAKVKQDFDAARKLVDQARGLKAKGEGIERTGDKDGAVKLYVQARRLYTDALEMTEEWIEPDLGTLNKDQVKRFMGAYVSERDGWVKDSAAMGRDLHR